MERYPTQQMSRRTTLRMMASLGVMTCQPNIASARNILSTSDALAKRLSYAEFPFSPAHIDVLAVTKNIQPHSVSVITVVRLTWPAGTRTRKFQVDCPCEDTALAEVSKQILNSFTQAVR